VEDRTGLTGSRSISWGGTRRWWVPAVLAAAMLGGGAASSAHAAPLVAEDSVDAPLVEGPHRNPILFTVESTAKCDQECRRRGGIDGLARIGIPPAQLGAGGDYYPLGWSNPVDPVAQPQIENSGLSGYVTLEKGSCASAKLKRVVAGPALPQPEPDTDPGEIVVQYRCKRDQAFRVGYHPTVYWHDFDDGADNWAFSLSHRKSPGRPWRLLPSSLDIEVEPFFIQQPNLLYTAPAAPITQVAVNEVEGQPSPYFTLDGVSGQGVQVRSQIQTGAVVDSSGDPLALVSSELAIVNLLRNIDQVPLQVTPCADVPAAPDPAALAPPDEIKALLCADTDSFGIVGLIVPEGVYLNQTEGIQAWMQVLSATMSTHGFAAAARDCLAAGGSFTDVDEITPGGQAFADWRCTFPASLGMTNEELIALGQTWDDFWSTFCLSRDVGWEVDFPGGGGADNIWCGLDSA